MNKQELARELYAHPEKVGIAVGFRDLTPLHGEWLRQMVWGDGDYTLLAHRSAYKSSCLAVAISLMLVLQPTKNIIFLRKADNDVDEMLNMVEKILRHRVMQNIVNVLHGVTLQFNKTKQSLSTNLWTSPMGASQLLGIGLSSSITGKHAPIVITDDICNLTDRLSRAEREKTKLRYQELQNIKNRDGRIINLGTKWHADDVFTLMENINVYDYKKTGLISEEKIKKLQKSMTASLFACNYELKIIADEDVLFANPQTGYDFSLVEQGTAHFDAAFFGEDYTAFTIVKKHGEDYYVFGKCWRKHVDDCMADMVKYRKTANAGKMFCETNADKGASAKELRRMGEIVSTYHEDMNKHLKITTYLKFNWEHIKFVEGTDQAYISQVCDYNDHAEHDDCPDSLASLIRQMAKHPEQKYEAVWA